MPLPRPPATAAGPTALAGIAMTAAHANCAMTFASRVTVKAVLAITTTALAILAIAVTVLTADSGVGNFGVGDIDITRWRLYCLGTRIDYDTRQRKQNDAN